MTEKSAAYQNKLAYNARYNRTAYKSITFRLSRVNDAEIIDFLEQVDITAFMKHLLKEKISKNNLYKHLRSKEKKTAQLGYPYEVYEIESDGRKTKVMESEDIENARSYIRLRKPLNRNYILIKKYINAYGTIVAMKVNWNEDQ